jgi:CBS domain-containing protein
MLPANEGICFNLNITGIRDIDRDTRLHRNANDRVWRLHMKAKDIMVRNVVSVKPDDSIYTAIRLMLAKGISGLPVVDAEGKPIGVVTEGDFLRRIESETCLRRPRWLEFLTSPGVLASEYVKSASRRVDEVMTPNVEAVTEDTPVADIVDLMEKRRIKRVPVVRDGRIVGIVSRNNLLRALVHGAAETRNEGGDDETIRQSVLQRLKGQPWTPASSIEVEVKNGIARISGVITDERERDAMRVCVRNTPGVIAVEDAITFIEPLSGVVFPPPG